MKLLMIILALHHDVIIIKLMSHDYFLCLKSPTYCQALRVHIKSQD